MYMCAPVMVARMRPVLLLRARICPSKGRKNFHFYTANMAGQNWPQQPGRARKGPIPPFCLNIFWCITLKVVLIRCVYVWCAGHIIHTHTHESGGSERVSAHSAHSSSSVPDPGAHGAHVARAKRTQLC